MLHGVKEVVTIQITVYFGILSMVMIENWKYCFVMLVDGLLILLLLKGIQIVAMMMRN